ncbi:hypothetical protein CFP56_018147 [Quercus suber]|uniref:Apple domain-containing protein n=1 Tax=Quercus suber TaxID=58331 RepID=A0AAW0KLM9_QUESU
MGGKAYEAEKQALGWKCIYKCSNTYGESILEISLCQQKNVTSTTSVENSDLQFIELIYLLLHGWLCSNKPWPMGVNLLDFTESKVVVEDSNDNCESICLHNCSCTTYGEVNGIGYMIWQGESILAPPIFQNKYDCIRCSCNKNYDCCNSILKVESYCINNK